METTATTTGTTIEVLAPYLPYAIEVQYTEPAECGENPDGSIIFEEATMRQKLAGLLAHGEGIGGAGTAILLGEIDYFGEYDGDDEIQIGRLLPVLRPLEDLIKPLANGTVPAVELARMIFDDMVGEGGEITAGFDHFGNCVVAEGCARVMAIHPDWTMSPEDGLHAGPAEYAYLRRHHFAVGLEPHQYIAK
jgi:hypothetical protein